MELALVIAWLGLTAIGIVLAATMISLCASDLKFLKRNRINGDIQRFTRATMWQEIRRFVVKLILFLIGVSAFFVDEDREPPHGGQWVGVVALFLIVGLLNYSSLAAMRFRKQFLGRPTTQILPEDPEDEPKGEKVDA